MQLIFLYVIGFARLPHVYVNYFIIIYLFIYCLSCKISNFYLLVIVCYYITIYL